jgi:ABC-2 type transport system permease protein
VGQSDIYPPVLAVRPSDRELLSSVEPNGNPLKLLIGHFDLAFVVLFLYPLFILAVSFDLLASEREQGTLALIGSQPVSIRALLFGKVAARALLTVATTLICALIGFLLTGTVTSGPDAALRLLFWFVAVAVYGAVWFGLAVWINSWGRGSLFNALSAVSCWLLATFLVPAFLVITAEKLYPLPRSAELAAVRREADFEANERRNRMSPEEQQALISGFIESNPELQQPGAWNDKGKSQLFIYAQRQATAHRVDPQVQRVAGQRKRQAAFVRSLTWLSPALLLQGVLYDLAGTGPGRREHFIDEAARYQRDFERFLWPRILTGGTISSTELKDIPRFKYREEASSAVVRRIVLPIVGLLCLGAVFWLAGIRRCSFDAEPRARVKRGAVGADYVSRSAEFGKGASKRL